MKEPARPDPDALLDLARREGRGRLKVFLGAAPGVGKTFEMLAEARRRQAGGAEVLVGIVETHGRAETAAQLGSTRPVAFAYRSPSGEVHVELKSGNGAAALLRPAGTTPREPGTGAAPAAARIVGARSAFVTSCRRLAPAGTPGPRSTSGTRIEGS